MFKNILFILLFWVITIPCFSQNDKTVLINDIYQRASKLYEDDKITDCLTLLNRAETLAATPVARILYLKIKALSSLKQNNENTQAELKHAVSAFNSVAQAQNFPEVKILEIGEIANSIKESEAITVQQKIESVESVKEILDVANQIEAQMVLIKTKKWQYIRKENNNKDNTIGVQFSPFYYGKYQITNRQWAMVMRTNPSKNNTCEECPVENVSFNDVGEFIDKINKASGRKYKLPTNAQWEYVAVQISLKSFPYFYKRMDDNINYTLPVTSDEANKEGIHNTGGNVREWCRDNYQPVLLPPSDRVESRMDYVFLETSNKFTVRGASWRMKTRLPRVGFDSADIAFNLLCYRSGMDASEKADDLGFRLCRN